MKVGRFEVRLSEQDRQRLRELATLTQRSESDLIRFLIAHAERPQHGGIPPVRVSATPPLAVEEREDALAA